MAILALKLNTTTTDYTTTTKFSFHQQLGGIPMSQPLQFGHISYDVPDHMRKKYQRLRSLFRRRAIMQTMSSYLFPWGMAKDVEDGLQKINQDETNQQLPPQDRVRYSIFKYDETVSGQALIESAMDAMRKQLSRMKSVVNDKVTDVLMAEEADKSDAVKTAKVACRKANSILRDMQALALVFNLTDNMDAAFVAYAAWVEEKKNRLSELEGKEEEKEEEETNDVTEANGVKELNESNSTVEAVT